MAHPDTTQITCPKLEQPIRGCAMLLRDSVGGGGEGFTPECGAFFKRRPLYNRIVAAIGSTPILMTRWNLGNSLSYICQLHQQALELLTQGIHLVSTDEMSGLQQIYVNLGSRVNGIVCGVVEMVEFDGCPDLHRFPSRHPSIRESTSYSTNETQTCRAHRVWVHPTWYPKLNR